MMLDAGVVDGDPVPFLIATFIAARPSGTVVVGTTMGEVLITPASVESSSTWRYDVAGASPSIAISPYPFSFTGK